MATLTVQLAGSSVVNGSKTYTLSDADVQTIIDFMATKYGTVNQDGSVTPLTNAQSLLAWVQNWVTQTRDEIRSVKLLAAQQQAVIQVNVPPVVFG
jgi:hypothetical protein